MKLLKMYLLCAKIDDLSLLVYIIFTLLSSVFYESYPLPDQFQKKHTRYVIEWNGYHIVWSESNAFQLILRITISYVIV